MIESNFLVRVADLEVGPQRLACPVPIQWLERALAETEARPRGDGRLELELTLNEREVMARGFIQAPLTMPCSVTLDPVEVEVKADVFLLLTRKEPPRIIPKRLRPVTAKVEAGGTASADGGSKGPKASAKEGAERAPHKGKSAVRDDRSLSNWGEAPVLTDKDAAEDTYEGDKIALDPYLREFILLELPINPKRSDLRSDEDVAIALRSAGLATEQDPPPDPRLAPLAAIASRMRQKKE